MENELYNVTIKSIEKENDGQTGNANKYDCVVFNIKGKEHEINLNSEDQSGLKNLFYDIIDLSFNECPKFELDDAGKNYENRMIVELVTDYLEQLNSEISVIVQNKPDISFD